jgi:hypothetical protein
MATFNFNIQTSAGLKAFSLDSGSTTFFTGANGGGKTRLATEIETELRNRAHRIGAHRALNLNPTVPKISEQKANFLLRFGGEGLNEAHRPSHRWANKLYTGLLNDFDSLVQVLFAEQSNTALNTHKNVRLGDNTPVSPTKLEILQEIWEDLIPHRKLRITGDDIFAVIPGTGNEYSASDLSDGERSIFYLIGQVLCAAQDTLLIFDEPELHIHRSVMTKLWDKIISLRQDCAFIMISHDLEFVASQPGTKYVIKQFIPNTTWDIEPVPEAGFTEELTTKILGSRKPILFVEGDMNSLDFAIYRACYPNWTVIPRSSCEEVIRSVNAMQGNAELTRVTCAGLIDADGYVQADRNFFTPKNIHILPVSEIENLLLLPAVAEQIAIHEGYRDNELAGVLENFHQEIYNHVNQGTNKEDVVVRYCTRRVDRLLKRVDLGRGRTVQEIEAAYAAETAALNITDLANERRQSIDDTIAANDTVGLLALYDNKGMVSIAASRLKRTNAPAFENWIVRVLNGDIAPNIKTAIQQQLPVINPA